MFYINNDLIVTELLQLLPNHIFWKDINGVYRGCNKIFAQGLGFSAENDVIGKSDYELPIDKKISDLYRQDDLSVIRSKTPKLNIEEEQTFINGKKGYLLTSKVPLLDKQGNAVGILGVYIDITARKIAEQELLRSKNAAEIANRAKTEFLEGISHDVVTPLVTLRLIGETIMENADKNISAKGNMIANCAQRLLSFFENCLKSSRVELSTWSAKEEVFSLSALLDDIHALFFPTAKTKHLVFNVICDPAIPKKLIGYRDSIYRVILNLVGNALKFTENGEISVRAFVAEHLNENKIIVGIEVKDTGVGIPEDKQKVIFEKLRRLTPSYESQIEGSGIGLYIVDQYVKRMGGEIQVKSKVGEGIMFTVLLPMAVVSQ